MTQTGPGFPDGQKAFTIFSRTLLLSSAIRIVINLIFWKLRERYKRLKQVVDAFNQEAEKIAVKMKLKADFLAGLTVPGQQYETIRDVFTSLSLGKMVFSAEPADDETKQ